MLCGEVGFVKGNRFDGAKARTEQQSAAHVAMGGKEVDATKTLMVYVVLAGIERR